MKREEQANLHSPIDYKARMASENKVPVRKIDSDPEATYARRPLSTGQSDSEAIEVSETAPSTLNRRRSEPGRSTSTVDKPSYGPRLLEQLASGPTHHRFNLDFQNLAWAFVEETEVRNRPGISRKLTKKLSLDRRSDLSDTELSDLRDTIISNEPDSLYDHIKSRVGENNTAYTKSDTLKSIQPPTNRVSNATLRQSGLFNDLVDHDLAFNQLFNEDPMTQAVQRTQRREWAAVLSEKYEDQLMSEPKAELSKFQKWRKQKWRRFNRELDKKMEILEYLDFWKGYYKTIEGYFGSSVASYFRFLKWLINLNLFISVIMLGVIVGPQIGIGPTNFQITVSNENSTAFVNDALKCSEMYENVIENRTDQSKIVELLEGIGWVEKTLLFYGSYFDKTNNWDGTTTKFKSDGYEYFMSLAYLLSILIYFFFSLILMVKYIAHGDYESLAHSNDLSIYGFSHKIFVGWDYNLTREKAVKIKMKNVARELKAELQEQKRQEEINSRTGCNLYLLYVKRFGIHIFAVLVLCASGYVIYELVRLSPQWEKEYHSVGLFFAFLPALSITFLNVVVPVIFGFIAQFMDYPPSKELHFTISRTVLLRLASLVVLVESLRNQILGCDLSEQKCGSCIDCWENYVGQEFYKLVLLDFVTVIATTFFIEFPRWYVVKRFGDKKLIQKIGQQEFQITKNVLDVVYSQMLCWLGGPFCPLIPPITTAKFLIFFFLKKFSLLKNLRPPSRSNNETQANFFYMLMLLISLAISSVPFIYTVTRMNPSKGCGPFRIYEGSDYYMFSALNEWVVDSWLSSIYSMVAPFFSSIYILLLVSLIMTIYFHYTRTAVMKQKLGVLNEKLVLMSKDKEFLHEQLFKTTFINMLDKKEFGLNREDKKYLLAQYPKVGGKKILRVLNEQLTLEDPSDKEYLFRQVRKSIG